MSDVTRFVEALLRGRRPRTFKAQEQDQDVLRTAIELRAARPGSDAPREEFVTDLHRRLAAELSEREPQPGQNRRRVIQLAAVAAATAAATVAIEHTVGDQIAAEKEPDDTLVPQHGTWQLVADTLPEGEVKSFDVGGVTGFVRRAGGKVDAVSGMCTHQGCRLRLDTGEKLLRCPCHDTTFALDGELHSHALRVSPAPLPHLDVRETSGGVEVFTPPEKA